MADSVRPIVHIVWDWNGMLFDDFDIILEAVNDSLVLLDAGPIDGDAYRDHYARPIHRFYDALLGRKITQDELQRVNEEFFTGYRRRVNQGSLSAEATSALDLVASIGATQSVLSIAFHAELLEATWRLGVAGYMALIEGNKGAAGGAKSGLLATHIDNLSGPMEGIRPESIVVIGDSLDDIAAASDSVVRSILYDGRTHHRTELAATGVPVTGSVVAAVAMAVGG